MYYSREAYLRRIPFREPPKNANCDYRPQIQNAFVVCDASKPYDGTVYTFTHMNGLKRKNRGELYLGKINHQKLVYFEDLGGPIEFSKILKNMGEIGLTAEESKNVLKLYKATYPGLAKALNKEPDVFPDFSLLFPISPSLRRIQILTL